MNTAPGQKRGGLLAWTQGVLSGGSISLDGTGEDYLPGCKQEGTIGLTLSKRRGRGWGYWPGSVNGRGDYWPEWKRGILAWVEEKGIIGPDGRGEQCHPGWKRRGLLVWMGNTVVH